MKEKEPVPEYLKYINELDIKSNRNLKYPPILDIDPSMAAKFLTFEDCQKSLELMQETYELLGTEQQKNKLLEWSMTFNRVTYDWFALFTRTLCELLDVDSFEIPEFLGDEEGIELMLCPPMFYKKGVVSLKYYEVTNKNPIDQYRIQYIGEAYDATDFRDGFPIWYSLSNTTIYERYSLKNNTRVRIDHCNGELQYFIAGASDNWKKIVGVPLEMDDVIINLLFRG